MFGCCGYSGGYSYECSGGYGNGSLTYSIILVLFILLVIIGCTCYRNGGKSC